MTLKVNSSKVICELTKNTKKDDPNHKHDKDPHVWLSPDHAILIVNHIRDGLSEADPAHKAGYEQRPPRTSRS